MGEPLPALVTTPVVDAAINADVTWAAVNDGFLASTSAAPPATCGEAIDVPLIVFVAVVLLNHDDVIPTPGAKISRQEPKLEKEALASVLLVAPTVIAVATRDGLELHAFALLLPAATA